MALVNNNIPTIDVLVEINHKLYKEPYIPYEIKNAVACTVLIQNINTQVYRHEFVQNIIETIIGKVSSIQFYDNFAIVKLKRFNKTHDAQLILSNLSYDRSIDIKLDEYDDVWTLSRSTV